MPVSLRTGGGNGYDGAAPPYGNRGRLEPLFKSLFEIYTQKTYLYQWRQNLLLEQILCEILSALHGENAPAELIRLKKVLEHLHEDPARPFTLEDLTARSGVKKTLCLQSFRRMTGTTPKQYICLLYTSRCV